MNIALVNTCTPFVRGGAEILVDDLKMNLIKSGHHADLIRIPFPLSFEVPLLKTIEAVRLLDFSQYDQVIAFKFPAYYIQHNNKVLWLFHQFRQVYDLWETEYGLQSDSIGLTLRDIIMKADQEAIGSARKVFTNALEVRNRLKHFNGLSAEVLWPPLKNTESYKQGEAEPFFFYPSRITSLKRQLLVVQAMKHVPEDVKLVIAGIAEDRDYLDAIMREIKQNGLESKVIVKNEFISDESKIDLLSRCMGVIYTPFNEDSCGFVTMEGFYSAKPVITLEDSGGTHDLVNDDVNGKITLPSAREIAAAISLLANDREKAYNMGQLGLQKIQALNLTWSETMRKLLS